MDRFPRRQSHHSHACDAPPECASDNVSTTTSGLDAIVARSLCQLGTPSTFRHAPNAAQQQPSSKPGPTAGRSTSPENAFNTHQDPIFRLAVQNIRSNLRRVVRDFYSITRSICFFLLVNNSNAAPVPTRHSSTESTTNNDSLNMHPTAKFGALSIMFLTTLAVPHVGRRTCRNKCKSLPTITALMFAIMVGFANDPSIPSYIMGLFAGASLGSSLWLALMTVAWRNSNLIHFARYVGAWTFVYGVVQATIPAAGSNFLVAFNPFFSALGSVGLNALVNEKVNELVDLMVWMLHHLGFERRDIEDYSSSLEIGDAV